MVWAASVSGAEQNEWATPVRFVHPSIPGTEWLHSDEDQLDQLQNLVETLISASKPRTDVALEAHIGIAFTVLRRVTRYGGRASQALEPCVERAHHHLRHAVEKASKEAVLWRALGTAHLLNQETERGILALRSAQVLAPHLADEIEIDLRRILVEHKPDSAALTSRYRLAPTDGLGSERRVALVVAIHRKGGRLYEARALLIEALQKWNASLILRLEHAETLWAAGDVGNALAELSMMRSRHPTEPCCDRNLVAALCAVGLQERAQLILGECKHPVVLADMELAEVLTAKPSSSAGSLIASPFPTASSPAPSTPERRPSLDHASSNDSAVLLAHQIREIQSQKASGDLVVQSRLEGPCTLSFEAGMLLGVMFQRTARATSSAPPPIGDQFQTRLDRLLAGPGLAHFVPRSFPTPPDAASTSIENGAVKA